MIDIQTSTGVFLDLAPDAGFEIEMNNPILESDRIPVAFSTAITFPPSDTNRAVFGYLPAMLLPPTVLKVAATILAGGIPLLSGTLVYESVDENGNLVYTFTEKSLEDGLDAKLYELDLPDSVTAQMTGDELATSIRAGEQSGIGAPVLYDPEGAVTKFHNMPFSTNTRFTPCVSFARLFSGTGIQVNSAIAAVWSALYVLGLHKSFTGSIKGYSGSLSIADTMPDLTLLDLLKEFCRMTCSAVFVSNGGYVIVPFLSTTTMTPLNWDGKISDGHSFSFEKAVGYGFGYQQDDNGAGGITGNITPVNTLKGVLDARVDGQYTPVRCTQTGDTYSVPPGYIYPDDVDYAQTCELLHVSSRDYDSEIDGEKLDNHLSSSLIWNVPVCFAFNGTPNRSVPEGGGDVSDEKHYRMAGTLKFPKDGDDRETKAILGVYGFGQLVGKGYGMSDSGEDLQIAPSLDPYSLYSSFHSAFAAWLARDRQVISVDLDLSLQDIASFRMWQVVTVRNRLFLVKRLTLDVSVMTDRILCSAELISL